MPDSGLLDTLVKLASLGTSGICIFAIFWIGWLIRKPPPTPGPEIHKTLRIYMIICVVIAFISAGSGILNAIFKVDDIQTLVSEKQSLSEQIDQYKKKEQTYTVRGAVKKEDQKPSNDILILTRFPLLYTSPKGEIVGLEVWQVPDGKFPILA